MPTAAPSQRSTAASRRSTAAVPVARSGADRRVQELAFLEEVARLATSARTWDELMVTVVERATAAAGAEVCSLYLVDRDGSGVTLAATNGLDREQIGRARLPLGVGITGRVAQGRRPIVSLDVHRDPRFHWIRGVDQPQFTSMCSVPLLFNDAVIGVLNVQTVERRRFLRRDVRFLETLAALLAGIVEKGRLQREAEDQIEAMRTIDEARAGLVTVVTHQLRTPLAVVRAYLELLGGAASQAGHADAREWERAALEQVERLDRTLDSVLASLRAFPSQPPVLQRLDLAAVVDETLGELAPLLRRHRFEASFTERPLRAEASGEQLRRLLEYLLENAAKYAPPGGRIDVYGWRLGELACLAVTDDGPGIPAEWHERIFEPFVRLDDSPRGAGIGLFAARRLARTMGGDLRVEPRAPAGSQFVLELAAG
ncbi:MAG TPA: HAMP domain-containing sensor histidine kinase [Candidatus Limnocylindrales bacterium]|nr:HAMP domain-containing sensor histidine kinase [Candidatus Limnocylindrales bacterium]